MIETEEKKDYKRRVYYLPPNYKKGISILGQVYPVPNVLQSSFFFLSFSLLFYSLHLGWEWQFNAIVYLLLLVIFGGLGLHGVDGDDLFTFLKRWLRFHRTRRTAYYNPRVKTEAIMPQYEDSISGDLLPKERINRLYEGYRHDLDRKQRRKEKEREKEAIEQGGYIFKEDLKIERGDHDPEKQEETDRRIDATEHPIH